MTLSCAFSHRSIYDRDLESPAPSVQLVPARACVRPVPLGLPLAQPEYRLLEYSDAPFVGRMAAAHPGRSSIRRASSGRLSGSWPSEAGPAGVESVSTLDDL